MNKSAFDKLGLTEQLILVKGALLRARLSDIFENPSNAKTHYRDIIKVFHPDRFVDNENDEKLLAGEIAAILNTLYESVETMIANGAWDDNLSNSTSPSIINGEEYASRHISSDAIETLSLTHVDSGEHYVARVASSVDTNDLVTHEIDMLEQINGTTIYQDRGVAYIPEFYKRFKVGNLNGSILAYNNDGRSAPHELVSLRALGELTLNSVDPKLVGWLWKRLLFALDHVHLQGILHGAVVPDNILIDPSDKDHGMILADWSHATRHPHPIVTVVTEWKSLYPDEVWRKESPLRSLDTYMAAQSMLWALGVKAPEPMKRYFQAMLKGTPSTRPQNAGLLLENWHRVIYNELGWKKEFVPVGISAEDTRRVIDWSWWWNN